MNPFQEVILDPNKLVESMFTCRMDDVDRGKNLALMRVLKGALSMSKSTSGEETFRHNKLEKEFLTKSLKVFNRNIYYTACSHNSRKRNVLNRWNMVFGKQKSMNHSIKELEEILNLAIEDTNNSVVKREKKYTISWMDAKRKPSKKGKHLGDEDDEEDEENEGDDQPIEKNKPPEEEVILNTNDNLNRRGIPQLKLPRTVGIGKAARVIEEKKPVVKPPTPRPLTLAEEATGVTNYIESQKHIHDELIQRNILQKVKSGLTEKEMLYRFQLRSHLPESPQNCIDKLKSVNKVRTGTAEPKSAQRQGLFPVSNMLNVQSLPLLTKSPRKTPNNNAKPGVPRTSRSIRTARSMDKPVLPTLERSKTMFV